MADARIHKWVTRAVAACGHFWTTPGCPNVVCACQLHSITGDVIDSGDTVVDEVSFKMAVADSLGISVEDLIVEQVI